MGQAMAVVAASETEEGLADVAAEEGPARRPRQRRLCPCVFTNGTTGKVTVNCGDNAMGELVKPDGQTPSTGYRCLPATFYYVQGVNTWQARVPDGQLLQPRCTPPSPGGTIWGRSLTTGHPIRVGTALTSTGQPGCASSAAVTGTGFAVVELKPRCARQGVGVRDPGKRRPDNWVHLGSRVNVGARVRPWRNPDHHEHRW